MSFYITLPSNSSPKLFPNNKADHFFVKLPQTIDITANYEVGLVEIQFPNRYCLIEENELWVQYDSNKDGEEPKSRLILTIPPGKFHSVDKIIETLEKLTLKEEIRDGKVRIITTDCDKPLKKVVIKVNEPGDVIILSDKLTNFLGYFNGAQKLTSNIGDQEIDTNIKTVFVYCDLVASRVVGDVLVPLLRTVPIIDKRPLSVFRIYDKPHYIPLSRFSFDTVEILLTDALGQPIPFTSGTSVLTLHFRTRKHFELE